MAGGGAALASAPGVQAPRSRCRRGAVRRARVQATGGSAPGASEGPGLSVEGGGRSGAVARAARARTAEGSMRVEGERGGPGVATRRVTILNPHTGQELSLPVAEDEYVLFSFEEQGFDLPFSCRQGACTTCAFKVLEGKVHQPEAMGVGRDLREEGYGLTCVAYPRSDLVLELQDEDEVYDRQF